MFRWTVFDKPVTAAAAKRWWAVIFVGRLQLPVTQFTDWWEQIHSRRPMSKLNIGWWKALVSVFVFRGIISCSLHSSLTLSNCTCKCCNYKVLYYGSGKSCKLPFKRHSPKLINYYVIKYYVFIRLFTGLRIWDWGQFNQMAKMKWWLDVLKTQSSSKADSCQLVRGALSLSR